MILARGCCRIYRKKKRKKERRRPSTSWSWTSVRPSTLCPHRYLLLKLKYCGITGKTNKWIESWLFHHQQRVVNDGAASPLRSSTRVLGPRMFLLYVNNIGAKISPHTTIKLFADDALLYRTINNPSDELQLQHDFDFMRPHLKKNVCLPSPYPV